MLLIHEISEHGHHYGIVHPSPAHPLHNPALQAVQRASSCVVLLLHTANSLTAPQLHELSTACAVLHSITHALADGNRAKVPAVGEGADPSALPPGADPWLTQLRAAVWSVLHSAVDAVPAASYSLAPIMALVELHTSIASGQVRPLLHCFWISTKLHMHPPHACMLCMPFTCTLDLLCCLLPLQAWPDWQPQHGEAGTGVGSVQPQRILLAHTLAYLAQQEAALHLPSSSSSSTPSALAALEVSLEDVACTEAATALFARILTAAAPDQLEHLNGLIANVWMSGLAWPAAQPLMMQCTQHRGMGSSKPSQDEHLPAPPELIAVSPLHSCWQQLFAAMIAVGQASQVVCTLTSAWPAHAASSVLQGVTAQTTCFPLTQTDSSSLIQQCQQQAQLAEEEPDAHDTTSLALAFWLALGSPYQDELVAERYWLGLLQPQLLVSAHESVAAALANEILGAQLLLPQRALNLCRPYHSGISGDQAAQAVESALLPFVLQQGHQLLPATAAQLVLAHRVHSAAALTAQASHLSSQASGVTAHGMLWKQLPVLPSS